MTASMAVRDKDMRKLIRQAEEHGCTTELSGTGHVRVLNPEGERIAWASTSGSDSQRIKGLRSQLRRAGFDPASLAAKPASLSPFTDQEAPKSMAETIATPKSDAANGNGTGPTPPTRTPLVAPSTTVQPWQTGNNRERVRKFFDAHRDTLFDSRTVAQRCRLEAVGILDEPFKVASNVMGALRKKGEIESPKRGWWVLKSENTTTTPPEPEAPATSATAPLPGGTSRVERLHQLEALARANGSAVLPAVFETVTTNRQGHLILKDEHGDIWMAAPMRVDL